MIKRIFQFFFPAILSIGALYSTIYQTIDTERLIHCTLSSVHQNRISVIGGSIEKMMHPEGDVNFVLEETSGQIFVYPMVDYPPVTTLSIVMDDGLVQDVEITFERGPAESLILRYPIPPKEIECDFLCSNEETKFSAVIEEILSGKVSGDYISCDYPKAVKKIGRRVFAKLSGKLIKGEEAIYIWIVENRSGIEKRILEQSFSGCSTNWVYVDRHCLRNREKTLAIVGVKL